MLRVKECPVCGSRCESMAAHAEGHGTRLDLTGIECGRCGGFIIQDAFVDLLKKSPALWHRLSAWIRQQNQETGKWPELKVGPEGPDSWIPRKWPREQLDLLLKLLESRTEEYGGVAKIDLAADAVHLWARGKLEVVHLTEDGIARGWWQHRGTEGDVRSVVVTAAGYERLEAMTRDISAVGRVFVAMWFDKSMDELRDLGLCAGIRDAGYEPVLINQEPPSEHRIDSRIFVEIRACRALVADATGIRPSVMFEAGFAEGLGKPVIWTARRDTVGQLPFDTRQFLHVLWDSPQELASALKPVLQYRLGPGAGGGQGRRNLVQ